MARIGNKNYFRIGYALLSSKNIVNADSKNIVNADVQKLSLSVRHQSPHYDKDYQNRQHIF